MDAAGLLEHERSGGQHQQRFAHRDLLHPWRGGSGVICLNGAAARSAQPGFRDHHRLRPDGRESARKWKPTAVFVDARNRIARKGSSLHARV